jgi:hypothetical protein
MQRLNPEWNRIVEEGLSPELLSARVARDVRPFCPRFNVLSDGDKRAYWAHFFQALAGEEAELVPTANVRHKDLEVLSLANVRSSPSRGSRIRMASLWSLPTFSHLRL